MLDATVDRWGNGCDNALRGERKTDPNIQRAKYPEKLCRNIITLGGNDDQQQLNIVASKTAFNAFVRELEAKQEEAMWELKYKNLERMRERQDDAEARATRYGEEAQELQTRINRLEREGTTSSYSRESSKPLMSRNLQRFNTKWLSRSDGRGTLPARRCPLRKPIHSPAPAAAG